MKIIMTPEDIIKVGCWDMYVKYILKGQDPQEVLSKNEEFEITEKDALVIGILKNVRTPHLVHRLNRYLEDVLRNKSMTHKGQPYIQSKTVLGALESFLEKYPDYWSPDFEYGQGLSTVKEYITELREQFGSLTVVEIQMQFGSYPYVNSSQVNKLLNYNYSV